MSNSQKNHSKKKQTQSAKGSFKALKTSHFLFFLGGVWLVMIVVTFAAIGVLTNPKSVSQKRIKPTPTPTATVSQTPTKTNTQVPKIEKIPSSKSEKTAPNSVKTETKQPIPIWLVIVVVLSCGGGSWIITQKLRRLALRSQVLKSKSVNKKIVSEPPLVSNLPLPQESLPIANKPIKLSEINLSSPPVEQPQPPSFEDSPIKFPPISPAKNPAHKLSEQLKINRSQNSNPTPSPSESPAESSQESSNNYPLLPHANESEENQSPKIAVAPPERSVSLDVSEPRLTEIMDLRKRHPL